MWYVLTFLAGTTIGVLVMAAAASASYHSERNGDH